MTGRVVDRNGNGVQGLPIELLRSQTSTRRLPPLIDARSRAMVDVLVEAGADPNQRPTAYKDADVAEALLKAGAHVEDLDDGRSALWYAACRGNWRVVTVLLRAGAKPWGGTGISALECTRQARQGRASRPRTVLDRGGPTINDFDRVIALLESARERARSNNLTRVRHVTGTSSEAGRPDGARSRRRPFESRSTKAKFP